jgi:hypothetical protein
VATGAGADTSTRLIGSDATTSGSEAASGTGEAGFVSGLVASGTGFTVFFLVSLDSFLSALMGNLYISFQMAQSESLFTFDCTEMLSKNRLIIVKDTLWKCSSMFYNSISLIGLNSFFIFFLYLKKA